MKRINMRHAMTDDDKYIYLMSLVGVLPEIAKKDMADIKVNIDPCNWKGYCKKCGMVHIEKR